MVTRLAGEGMAVVLITHRMDEIDEIGDRITVMRSGETVATLEKSAWDQQEIVRLMTGAEHLVQTTERARRTAVPERQPVVLKVEGVRLAPERAPINVSFRKGEIVGLAGLEGHGQDRFLRLLHGQYPGGVSRVDGNGSVPLKNPGQAQELGISYVARDRRSESIFPWMSILRASPWPPSPRTRPQAGTRRPRASPAWRSSRSS